MKVLIVADLGLTFQPLLIGRAIQSLGAHTVEYGWTAQDTRARFVSDRPDVLICGPSLIDGRTGHAPITGADLIAELAPSKAALMADSPIIGAMLPVIVRQAPVPTSAVESLLV